MSAELLSPVMKPLPTMLVLQLEQMKQSLCQCLPSNEIKRVPPIPDSNEQLVLTLPVPATQIKNKLHHVNNNFSSAGVSGQTLLNKNAEKTENKRSRDVLVVRMTTCDGLGAGSAPLAEQFTEAVCTVGLVIPGGESLSGQGLLAVGAGEALPVPGVVPVGHPALCDHLKH